MTRKVKQKGENRWHFGFHLKYSTFTNTDWCFFKTLKSNSLLNCNLNSFVLILISLFALHASNINGQDNLSKNNFSVGLINEISTTTPRDMSGEEKMLKSYGLAHIFALNYTRKFNNTWSLKAGWGFGAYPLFYKTQESPGIINQNRNYFYRTNYTGFSRLQALVNYNYSYNNSWNGSFYAGFGVRHFREHGLGMGRQNVYVTFKYGGNAKPFVSVGKEFYKILNSKNELVFKLGFNYSFRNIYTAEYQINSTSNGTLINDGSNFNCSIFYRFTGQKRKNKISELVAEGNQIKDAEKQVSIKKRAYDPESYFISFFGGLGYGMNKSDNDYFLNKSWPSFSGRVTLEKGFANKFFVESGLHGMEYYSTLGIKGHYFSSNSNAALPIFISLGGGYRFITKERFKLLNLHSGISVGIHDRPKGIASSSSMGVTNEPGYVSKYNLNYHNIFLNLYLGGSKDFKLTNRLFISIQYRHQIGLYPFIQSRIKHYSNQSVRKGNINIDGSAHHFEVGLKYRFNKFSRK